MPLELGSQVLLAYPMHQITDKLNCYRGNRYLNKPQGLQARNHYWVANMKKIFSAALLLIASANAAAEWTLVEVYDEYELYVDFAKIKKTKQIAKTWYVTNFLEPQKQSSDGLPYLSMVIQDEFNCTEELVKTLTFNVYAKEMGSGRVIYTESPKANWTPVASGTAAELLKKIACGEKTKKNFTG